MDQKNNFHYLSGKDKVIIYWQNNAVKNLKDQDAAKFLMNITDMNERQAQIYMAKLTGNFNRDIKS